MGLRELKKEQTRELIGDTAWRLFAEKGFDSVTVAEVARVAQVAPATVFNYFGTKEDLFYWRLETLGTRLVEAVDSRPAGSSALDAFRLALTAQNGLLSAASEGSRAAAGQLRTANRLIASSPALLRREQQALDRFGRALAESLAADTGDEVLAHAAASALVGVHRALLSYVRGRVLAGDDLSGLGAEVQARMDAAFGLLIRGLGDYAVRA